MREIKFRGKDLKYGNWHYGSYVYLPDSRSHHIIPCGSYKPHIDEFCVEQAEIDPETLGQYTWTRDSEGEPIYEGDILEMYLGSEYAGDKRIEIGVSCFDEHRFYVETATYLYDSDYLPFRTKVIGNIHGNPDLMKGGEK